MDADAEAVVGHADAEGGEDLLVEPLFRALEPVGLGIAKLESAPLDLHPDPTTAGAVAGG